MGTSKEELDSEEGRVQANATAVVDVESNILMKERGREVEKLVRAIGG